MAAVILTIVFHIVVFVFLNVKGKDVLKDIVKKNYGAEAEVGSLTFRFPFTVVIKDFKCADLSFKNADISLGFFNPFGWYLNLNRVYLEAFNFRVKKEKDKISLAPFFTKETAALEPKEQPALKASSGSQPTASSRKKTPFSFKIGKLYFKDGSGEIIDLTRDAPITYVLKNLNLEVKHLLYPQLTKFYVKLSGSLERGDRTMKDVVNVRGWVDYAHKNMDMEININNVDYLAFSDYYPPFWKPDNLGIKEAQLSCGAKFNSKDNDLVIDGILSLDKIEFIEAIDNNSNAKMLRTIIAFYKGDSEKATLPIRLRTKMDSFKLDFSSIQYDFKDKIKIGPIIFIQNALDKTKGIISEKVKEAGENTKEAAGKINDIKDAAVDKTVDKAVDIIKDVVGAVGGVVKGGSENKLQSNIVEEQGSSAGAISEYKESTQPQFDIQIQESVQPGGDVKVEESAPTQEDAQSQNVQLDLTKPSQDNTQTQQNTPVQENTTP